MSPSGEKKTPDFVPRAVGVRGTRSVPRKVNELRGPFKRPLPWQALEVSRRVGRVGVWVDSQRMAREPRRFHHRPLERTGGEVIVREYAVEG